MRETIFAAPILLSRQFLSPPPPPSWRPLQHSVSVPRDARLREPDNNYKKQSPPLVPCVPPNTTFFLCLTHNKKKRRPGKKKPQPNLALPFRHTSVRLQKHKQQQPASPRHPSVLLQRQNKQTNKSGRRLPFPFVCLFFLSFDLRESSFFFTSPILKNPPTACLTLSFFINKT